MDCVSNKEDRWMRWWFWKIFGALIMLYVLIGGMTVPLKPGILEVYGVSSAVSPGDIINLKIKGYNTHFADSKQNAAYLKLNDSHFLKANNIDIVDNWTLNLNFNIPKTMINNIGVDPLTLIVSNPIDGYALQPNAVSIRWQQVNSESNKNNIEWQSSMQELFQVKTFAFPYRNILNETIRNTFFHVALWLAMIVLLIAGLVHAVKYLKNQQIRDDMLSSAYNKIGILYGILGLATGSIWAKHTWGTWWTTDVKLNMAAIAMLIYAAYLVLRSSTNDLERRAKLSAGYSIFAFVALIPLIFVIPRLYDSLHPGNGGNPALGGEDLDNTLRMFFYPSIFGLILLGAWMATLSYRTAKIENEIYSNN